MVFGYKQAETSAKHSSEVCNHDFASLPSLWRASQKSALKQAWAQDQSAKVVRKRSCHAPAASCSEQASALLHVNVEKDSTNMSETTRTHEMLL